MPTVIDSLVISLGLDASAFTKGQRQATDAFNKTKTGAVAAGRQMEESNKRLAQTFEKVRNEALGFFAVLLGARGIKDFVANITRANAELGRFATSIGTSPQLLSAWQMAAERMGGSADATSASFENMARALYNLKQNGKALPQEFYRLAAAANIKLDTEHGPAGLINSVAGALKKISETDMARAHFLAQGMGFDDATANLMIRYGDGVTAYVAGIQKSLAPSASAIQAAQKLQEAFVTLQQSASSLGNTIVSSLTPVLVPLIDGMSKWIQDNKDWIATGITQFVKDFAEYLKSIDWAAIGKGLENFGASLGGVSNIIHDLIIASEVFFGLWAASKVLGLAASIATIGGAIGASAGGRAGGGLLARAGAGIAGYLAEGLAASGGAGVVAGLLGVFGLVAATKPNRVDPLTGTGDAAGIYERSMRAQQARNRDPEAARGDAYHQLTVNGREITRGNPLPVVIASMLGLGSDGSGGPSDGGAFLGGGGGGSPSAHYRGSGGVGGWWTPERMKHAADRLEKEAGLSPMGAAALVARWAAVESPGGPSSVNPYSHAIGIAQDLGSRQSGLTPQSSFDDNLTHNIAELNSTEARAAAILRSKGLSPEGYATGASAFERAEGYNPRTGVDNFTSRTPVQAVYDKIHTEQPSTLWRGSGAGAWAPPPAGASLSPSVHNQSSSNQSSVTHVAKIEVNAPHATDADGIAAAIAPALSRYNHAAMANSGQA